MRGRQGQRHRRRSRQAVHRQGIYNNCDRGFTSDSGSDDDDRRILLVSSAHALHVPRPVFVILQIQVLFLCRDLVSILHGRQNRRRDPMMIIPRRHIRARTTLTTAQQWRRRMISDSRSEQRQLAETRVETQCSRVKRGGHASTRRMGSVMIEPIATTSLLWILLLAAPVALAHGGVVVFFLVGSKVLGCRGV